MSDVEGRVDDRVAAALSHDVRGALRGVTGFLGLLGRDIEALPDDMRGYLDTALRSAATADLMVERLVHWIRLEYRPVTTEPVELSSVIGPAIAEAAERLGRTDEPPVEVTVTGTVEGNRPMIVGCLAELLANAFVFGGDDVQVAMTSREADGWVTVDVADDGPGIPADLAEAAFELFRLLQPRGRYPGVGMGLPLARRLAEVQGGSVWIDTDREPGEPGTTVHLRLPTA